VFVSPRARRRARELGLDPTTLRGSGPRGRVVEEDVLAAAAVAAPTSGRVLATPLARKLAEEHGLELAAVVGSGPGGRVTQDDVRRALAERVAATPPTPAADAPVAPLSRLRRITAERMAASARSVARVTLHLEADFTEAARFRQQLAPEFARLGVPRLPWDALLAKAAGLALAEHPRMLAQWVEGEGLRQPSGVHIGVAVALEPEGLVVPVLRDAATRSLRALTADLLALVEKARAGRLLPDEMQGGTFTITNLGAYRIDGFTPIINPPETAILGVGRIADKPAVVDGQLAIRTLCTLSLSFDHRVVDGAPAAAFLRRLAELLERPYALLGI
jgi:pyruvate dehydrogenase E2 component (dihydrolipoamide acetyltransferase)